jgi:hypothetical protein
MRWEYLVTDAYIPLNVIELNAKGQQHWELVSVTPGHLQHLQWHYVFKREITRHAVGHSGPG